MIRQISLTLVRAADVNASDTIKFTDRLHFVCEFGRDRLDQSKLCSLEITSVLYESVGTRLELLISHLDGQLPVLVVSEEFQNGDGSVNEAALLRYLSETDASIIRWTVGQPSASGPLPPLVDIPRSYESACRQLRDAGATVLERRLPSTSIHPKLVERV